jgi:hypothetical protein
METTAAAALLSLERHTKPRQDEGRREFNSKSKVQSSNGHNNVGGWSNDDGRSNVDKQV